VRATLADVVPLIGDLADLLKPRLFSHVRLKEDPLLIHLHRGGWDAVYYKLVGDRDTHLLEYIEVRGKTKLPRVALDLGRAAINRLLDTLSTNWKLPAVIARLDLLTLETDDVLLAEIVIPFSTKLEIGPLGGMDQSPMFAPWLATLREALIATSPYCRLLCAWRTYDGVRYLRQRIRKISEQMGITAPLPKDPDISVDSMREARVPSSVLEGVKNTADLFARFERMRDGVAHFLLRGGEHVYFSEGATYWEYAIASTILLQAAITAVNELHAFYSEHVESKTRIGSVSPDRKHADKWIVYHTEFCPRLSDKDFR